LIVDRQQQMQPSQQRQVQRKGTSDLNLPVPSKE